MLNLFVRIIPTTNARGVRREVPTVVNLYNKKMGGVDLGDQHIQSYDPDVRSLKMWKKLLINMILRVIGTEKMPCIELFSFSVLSKSMFISGS